MTLPTKSINEFGDEYWELPNGNWHREDGPGVIWSDGELSWYLKYRLYDFDEYCAELKKNYGKTDEDLMLLRMQYDIN